jgi:hypothetical protein
MSRQLFNHLFVELSVCVGTRIPRYALWLRLHDLGCNPEALRLSDALAFCDGPVDTFLADRGFSLTRRAQRRLRKSLAKFDPLRPLPKDLLDNWMESE